MSKSKAQSNGHLTPEQLRDLKASVLFGDQYWGMKHADRTDQGEYDSTDLAVHTLHHVAMRKGLAEEDLYSFLNKIRLEDMEVLNDDEEPAEDPLAQPAKT